MYKKNFPGFAGPPYLGGGSYLPGGFYYVTVGTIIHEKNVQKFADIKVAPNFFNFNETLECGYFKG